MHLKICRGVVISSKPDQERAPQKFLIGQIWGSKSDQKLLSTFLYKIVEKKKIIKKNFKFCLKLN